jgi:hypothetical protein
MKNLSKVLTVAAAISLAAAAEARADFSFPLVCGGNSFATCASVTLATDASGTFTTLSVTNLAGEGDVYKTVGLINIPADVTVTITSAPAGYTPVSEDPDINIVGYNDFGSGAQAPPTDNGLEDGESGVWVFTFSRALTQQEIDALGFGVHAISGPNNCSTQFGVLAGGAVNNVDEEAYARCGSETTVPEPITMTLLATGLAGMGGAGFVRRRNKKTVA